MSLIQFLSRIGDFWRYSCGAGWDRNAQAYNHSAVFKLTLKRWGLHLKIKTIYRVTMALFLIGAAGTVLAMKGIEGENEALALPSGFNQPNAIGAHDLPNPLGDERRAMRLAAKQAELNGTLNLHPGGKAHKNDKGKFVELTLEDEDLIWTVTASFGPTPSYIFGGMPGPVVNEIPEPDRNVDNVTIWREDFNRDYYMDMLFSDTDGDNSMRNFYKEMSAGRYAVDGHVTEWVGVPYNTAHYGTPYCGRICPTVWWFVRDSLNAWYESQLDAGETPEEIDAYLSQFDTWDRYDHDGDGDFDEPDGYIDHFQSVHAGEGAEAGGGSYGSAAIWSHRWYAFYWDTGFTGPASNLAGGLQIGGSSYWVGDYTIEPENGGVGVFAHEFGHDLGLPDLYDTSGGDNSTGFWTLMSSGSWGSDGTVDIGSKPTPMGAWEKLQLGWLKYEMADSSKHKSKHKLAPAEHNSDLVQALIIPAPDKVVETFIAEPEKGDHFYYSGIGNNLDQLMLRAITLPGGSPMVTAMVNYDIETDYDYAYLVVSTDDGASHDYVATNSSTNSNPSGNNFGNGITGYSAGWVPLTADLTAYAGEDVLIGFRYWTDPSFVNLGFMVDSIVIGDDLLDGAESDTSWSLGGFSITDGNHVSTYMRVYIAAFRQYIGYDEALETGPYNFTGQGRLVEHFPYQDGLLISLWDTSQMDNNTKQHPGEGLILPIDAHPEPLIREDVPGDVPWRSRVQTYDSTFGEDKTDAITLHVNGLPSHYPSLEGVSKFDANMDYWSPMTPTSGVDQPKSDLTIKVKHVHVDKSGKSKNDKSGKSKNDKSGKSKNDNSGVRTMEVEVDFRGH